MKRDTAFLSIILIAICLGTMIFQELYAPKKIVIIDCVDENNNKIIDLKCEKEQFLKKSDQILEIVIIVITVMSVFWLVVRVVLKSLNIENGCGTTPFNWVSMSLIIIVLLMILYILNRLKQLYNQALTT